MLFLLKSNFYSNRVKTFICFSFSFGSGYMSPSTGMILNNEMNDFSTPGVPNHYKIPPSPSNFIAPGKRPLSSMCPTVFTDEKGEFVLAAGAAGGSKITLATSYVRFY